MREAKYKTCIHSQKAGQIVIYVDPGCPRATMIKGNLVSSKKRCEECQSWKQKVQSRRQQEDEAQETYIREWKERHRKK